MHGLSAVSISLIAADEFILWYYRGCLDILTTESVDGHERRALKGVSNLEAKHLTHWASDDGNRNGVVIGDDGVVIEVLFSLLEVLSHWVSSSWLVVERLEYS